MDPRVCHAMRDGYNTNFRGTGGVGTVLWEALPIGAEIFFRLEAYKRRISRVGVWERVRKTVI